MRSSRLNRVLSGENDRARTNKQLVDIMTLSYDLWHLILSIDYKCPGSHSRYFLAFYSSFRLPVGSIRNTRTDSGAAKPGVFVELRQNDNILLYSESAMSVAAAVQHRVYECRAVDA